MVIGTNTRPVRYPILELAPLILRRLDKEADILTLLIRRYVIIELGGERNVTLNSSLLPSGFR